MKLAGLALLLAGWILVLAALILLQSALAPRMVFVLAGICIEILGFVLLALSLSWILGPRRGKFTAQGMPTAMPGHNAIIVMFSGILALLGWFGLNTAGAFLFGGELWASSF